MDPSNFSDMGQRNTPLAAHSGSPLFRRRLWWTGGGFFLIVVVAVVVLQQHPNAAATPKVTWSTPSVEVTLSPGETTTRTLTLTSDTTIKNVRLEAVSAIAPFETIQPSSFATLPANQPQTVRVSLTIPSNAILGTYDGTIHVRNGSKTISQTLKVDIRVWNSLIDSTLGFSIKYPPNLQRVPDTDPKVIGLAESTQDQDFSGLWFYEIDNPNGLTPVAWWATNHYEALSQAVIPRTVASLPAIEITIDPDGYPETHVVVAAAGKLYDIVLNIDRTTAESILDTLRF